MPGADAHRQVSVARCPGTIPHDSKDMQKCLPSGLGWRNTCSTNSLRDSLRLTSLRAKFRHPSNDSKWRRSPAINRSAVEVGGIPVVYKARWTGGTLSPMLGEGDRPPALWPTSFCSVGPALRTNTGKPTAVPADVNWRCATGAFSGHRQVFSCTRPPLRAARWLASSLQPYGASK